MEAKKEYSKRENVYCHYDKRLILDAVKSVEEGMPRKEVNRIYGLGASTLDSWMRDHGSKGYQEQKRKKISRLLRRKITAEVDQGHITAMEARKKYNIKSLRTIHSWLYKWRHENANFCSTNEPEMDKKKKKQAKATIAPSMEKALEDAQLKIEALNTMIDVAEEQLKINIRKKSGTKQ